jgi:hypothetical protein
MAERNVPPCTVLRATPWPCMSYRLSKPNLLQDKSWGKGGVEGVEGGAMAVSNGHASSRPRSSNGSRTRMQQFLSASERGRAKGVRASERGASEKGQDSFSLSSPLYTNPVCLCPFFHTFFTIPHFPVPKFFTNFLTAKQIPYILISSAVWSDPLAL